jgi:anti-anti-sigma factor
VSELARIEVERRGEATLARLSGEVDMSNAADVGAELAAAAQGAGGPLVVDLTGTRYLDSAWFRAIEGVALGLAAAGRSLHLVCPPDAPTRRLLDLSGMDRMLPLFASAEEAVRGG